MKFNALLGLLIVVCILYGGDVYAINPSVRKAYCSWLNARPESSLLNQTISSVAKHHPLEFVVFTDFECSYCRTLGRALEEAVSDAPDLVRVTNRLYPLNGTCNPRIRSKLHPFACQAAAVFLCAKSLNKDTARRVRQDLFELSEYSSANLTEIVKDIGEGATAIKQCVTSQIWQLSLSNDIELAARLGIKGTPRLFLNSKPLTVLRPGLMNRLLESIIKGTSYTCPRLRARSLHNFRP